MNAVFDFASGNTLRNRARPLNHQVARLYSQCIDSRILILKFQDKVNHRVVFPTAFVIVVINQGRVRPAFTSHVECRSHELVVAIIATERLDYIAVAFKTGMIATSAVADCTVHHFNLVYVGIMRGNGVEPGRNGLLGFIDIEPVQPTRQMSSLQQIAKFKLHPSFPPIYNRPIINRIAFRKIVFAAFLFDSAPCARVIRSNLIPVGVIVFGDCLTVDNDVTEIFFCASGKASPVAKKSRVLKISLEPGHRRTFYAVFDKSGITIRQPSFTINVSPKGYAGNVFRFHQKRNMFHVAFFLKSVVLVSDIVLRNVYGKAGLFVSFVKCAFEYGSIQTIMAASLNHSFVELHSEGIDGRTLLHDFLEKVYSLLLLPLDCIVVVVNQDGLRPAFTGHFKSSDHEFVVAAIAAECFNKVVAPAKTGVIVVAIFDGFVYHFDHFEVRVMFLNGIEPICNCFIGFVNIKTVQPCGIVGAPQKSAERKMCMILLCPVVGIVAIRPIVLATRFFDIVPNTLRLGGNLVPVSAKIFGNYAKFR